MYYYNVISYANHFRISYTYISYIMSCNAHTYNNYAIYATNQIDISSALTMNVAMMNEQRRYLMSYIYSAAAAAAATEKMEETVGHSTGR